MSKELGRHRVIQITFFIASLVLVAKAAQLQLVQSSNSNTTKDTTLAKESTYPSRGMIFDRNKELMVANVPMFDIEVIYKELDPTMDTLSLCQMLGISKGEFIKKINKDWSSKYFSKHTPFIFMKQVSTEDFSVVQEHLHKYPGFYPVLKNVRTYPHSNAAHLLGYLVEVDQKTIDTAQYKYVPGDYHGVSGLEKAYESELRGEKGTKYIIKNNLGMEVGRFEDGAMDSSAVLGSDLITTIDLELQQYAELLMANKKGSVVAIEPATGEILAMVSAPSYDPKLIVDRGQGFKDLMEDTSKVQPFLDRSVMATYPPGSIFKPIFSLIAMQEGILYPNRIIKCDGDYETNTSGQSQGCHDHPTPYNVQTAIQFSCNTYFYQLMREFIEIDSYSKPEIGLNLLVDYLRDFGLGSRISKEHSFENEGFLPSTDYYDRLYKTKYSTWRSTYILSLGIGQGEFQFNTLQMANLSAILANRGSYITPHLVKKFTNTDTRIPDEFVTPKRVKIDSAYFEPVVDGMERVIKIGTAQNAFVPGLDICGKTGTSQNPHGRDHSVFIGFAPKDNPKIAIAVLVENAGWGGDVAAPISSLVMEKYLNKEISRRRKWEEARVKSINLLNP